MKVLQLAQMSDGIGMAQWFCALVQAMSLKKMLFLEISMAMVCVLQVVFHLFFFSPPPPCSKYDFYKICRFI